MKVRAGQDRCLSGIRIHSHEEKDEEKGRGDFVRPSPELVPEAARPVPLPSGLPARYRCGDVEIAREGATHETRSVQSL